MTTIAKWADYLISGVWFSGVGDSKYISHVMLHQDFENTIGIGQKKTKDAVISIINNDKKTIYTIKWDSFNAKWLKGALVETENINGVAYLRTHRDATTSDNLDNSLQMVSFGI